MANEVKATKLYFKRGSNCIQLHYAFEGIEFGGSHYLFPCEIEHILNEKQFSPFYVDGMHLLQFTGSSIRIIDLGESKHTEQYLPFRTKEFFEQLELALKLEENDKLDLMPAYLKSLEMAKPDIEIVFEETKNLPGIEGFIARVITIGGNCSNGADDRVSVRFYKDSAPKSLYWEVYHYGKKRCVYNGGIIWHESQESWGIHT